VPPSIQLWDIVKLSFTAHPLPGRFGPSHGGVGSSPLTFGSRPRARPSPFAATRIARRDPTPHDVQIEILFCGICHSDLHQARNEWSGMPTTYPCVPGHEIVGRVTRVGSAVTTFKQGDLVGVGCLVDSDGTCTQCVEHFEQFCGHSTYTYNPPDRHTGQVTSGRYSESMVAFVDVARELAADSSRSR
jgi:D-arabinose 1-dehydrogenase-like Zn-dependent alcohol dehydrogenase